MKSLNLGRMNMETLEKEISLEEYGFISDTVTHDSVIDEDGEEVDGDDYILIELVYVKPEYRGMGIARKLLVDFLKKNRSCGMDIRLVALPKEDEIDIERLVKFYESVGFSIDDEQGGEGVFMTK
jgi:GNAT superfamily N-acetyltransferase